MTAPICGARTHGDAIDIVQRLRIAATIDEPTEYLRRLLVAAADEIERLCEPHLDALDPDAAIAEAERRMVDAAIRCSALSRIANDAGVLTSRIALERAHVNAARAEANAVAAWLALVEARDAKGGGV